VTITDFTYSDGRITISCVGKNQLAIAKFVSGLREVKDADGEIVFSNVEYTGASSNGGTWNSELNIDVRNKAEEEAAKEAEEAAKAAAAAESSEETSEEAK
jgi:hypothetical protein